MIKQFNKLTKDQMQFKTDQVSEGQMLVYPENNFFLLQTLSIKHN